MFPRRTLKADAPTRLNAAARWRGRSLTALDNTRVNPSQTFADVAATGVLRRPLKYAHTYTPMEKHF